MLHHCMICERLTIDVRTTYRPLLLPLNVYSGNCYWAAIALRRLLRDRIAISVMS